MGETKQQRRGKRGGGVHAVTPPIPQGTSRPRPRTPHGGPSRVGPYYYYSSAFDRTAGWLGSVLKSVGAWARVCCNPRKLACACRVHPRKRGKDGRGGEGGGLISLGVDEVAVCRSCSCRCRLLRWRYVEVASCCICSLPFVLVELAEGHAGR